MSKFELCIIAIAIVSTGTGLFIMIDNPLKHNVFCTDNIPIKQLKRHDTQTRADTNSTVALASSRSQEAKDRYGGEEDLTSTALDSSNSDDMSTEVEKLSRAYPVWIEDRRSIDSNSRPYDWCVAEDVATSDGSPKGLLFVKVPKCGSSTGSGVTLRIRDGLSRRFSHANTTAPGNCFAHYNHAKASSKTFQKRDVLKSFLWSIVREPAQRTLR